MRLQSSIPYHLLSMLLFAFCLLSTTMLTTAQQDEPPAPQFLYRDGNRLILVDGYTGDTTELPIEIAERDRFSWSPDGRYLVADLDEGGCLNLYDVDALAWAYDEPIACSVENTVFFADGMHIVYSTSDEINGVLWLYSLADETSKELYRTTEGNETYSSNISNIQWSPTETYLTFIDYHVIAGGSVNTFVVMNAQSQDSITVNAKNSYYAWYDSIWSENDDWFLIMLKDRYRPRYNHKGDVYLVNSATGEQHRLTYTPAVLERDIHWTDEGQIAFTIVIEEEVKFTIEEAMTVESVPQEDIVMPESTIEENDDYHVPSYAMVSPDYHVWGWVSYNQDSQTYQLYIGKERRIESSFSSPIPSSYEIDNTLIGWRPSNHIYPRG